jgi:hypothetical protein
MNKLLLVYEMFIFHLFVSNSTSSLPLCSPMLPPPPCLLPPLIHRSTAPRHAVAHHCGHEQELGILKSPASSSSSTWATEVPSPPLSRPPNAITTMRARAPIRPPHSTNSKFSLSPCLSLPRVSFEPNSTTPRRSWQLLYVFFRVQKSSDSLTNLANNIVLLQCIF